MNEFGGAIAATSFICEPKTTGITDIQINPDIDDINHLSVELALH